MKLNEIHEKRIHPDDILHNLVKKVANGQKRKPGYFGMVGACIVDPQLNECYALNHLNEDGHRTHAERAVLEAYERKYGDVPRDSVIITTLSPCSEHIHDREGHSCTDLINSYGIMKVHAGFLDPTQKEGSDMKRKFDVRESNDKIIKDMCKTLAESFLNL